MKPAPYESTVGGALRSRASLSGAHGRTLDAIFRHPVAHNLAWRDVLGLMGQIGQIDDHGAGDVSCEVAGSRYRMRNPASKDLMGSEVADLRQFLTLAGWSLDGVEIPAGHQRNSMPNLMVVVDHHEAKIFAIDTLPSEPSESVIRPYDPHHFLHHLTHKDQSRERGQRVPEDHQFYDEIALALAVSGKIVVVGHGTGKSDAAHHLTEFLCERHHEIYSRIIREITADLSSTTVPQLLQLARKVLN